MPVDPVCGMIIPEEHAVLCTDYKGKHYCFCSEDCRDQFEDDPESYVHQHEMSYEEEETF